MQNPGVGGKVAIIGVIVTALAGIITAVITISGPLLDKRIAIQATQTREAVLASPPRVVVVAMDTPSPAPAIVDSSPTAAPAVTLPPQSPAGQQAGNGQSKASSTPAGTLLRVGESATAPNGISVTLTKVEFPAGNEVHLHFTFTNPSAKVMNISLDHNRDVTLTDDKGNVYTWATAFTWAVSISPGTSRNDEVKRRGDVSRAGYFIVKLNIPGLLSAQWKN